MGNITAKLVKDLRDKTGAGMMDCKKALNETDGDLEKAIEWLRKKGIASADKKSGRGLKTKPSPINTFCSSKFIECLYYSDFENQDVYNALESMNPDLFVVVAFKILPEKIINIPNGSVGLKILRFIAELRKVIIKK